MCVCVCVCVVGVGESVSECVCAGMRACVCLFPSFRCRRFEKKLLPAIKLTMKSNVSFIKVTDDL